MDKRKKEDKAKPKEKCFNEGNEEVYCEECDGDTQADCEFFAPKPRERCLNYCNEAVVDDRYDCYKCNEDNQIDCSHFAPMGDPQKCPECGEELSEVLILKEQLTFSTYSLIQGALDELRSCAHWREELADLGILRLESTSTEKVIEVFDHVRCPKCSKTLPFDSIEEAKEFLKTGKLPKQE